MYHYIIHTHTSRAGVWTQACRVVQQLHLSCINHTNSSSSWANAGRTVLAFALHCS